MFPHFPEHAFLTFAHRHRLTQYEQLLERNRSRQRAGPRSLSIEAASRSASKRRLTSPAQPLPGH